MAATLRGCVSAQPMAIEVATAALPRSQA